MPSPIQEYLIGLGFAVDVLGLKRFEESLGSTARGFMNVTKTAAEMAVGVGIAVDEVASHYETLYYLSQRTGATVQNLQATAFGFSQVGLKADDARSMVDALALSLKFNPGTGALLRMMGVQPSGDANADTLHALYALRKMPPVLQKGFGEQLGESEYQLSMLLAPGALEKIEAEGADLKRRQREAGFDPDKLAANSVKFENAMGRLQSELGLIGDQVASYLVEPLTKFLILLEGYAEYWDRIFAPSSVTLKPGSARYALSQELSGEGGHVGALDWFGWGADSPAGRPAGGSAFRGGNSGQAGWWTPERQRHAMQTLVDGGVTPLGASALVSRWMNVESAGGPASVNPVTGAFGIGQWLGPRKPSIAGNTDFDDQLAYTLFELHTSETGALKMLNGATGLWDAARGASAYERAEGWNAITGIDNFTRLTAGGIGHVAPLGSGGSAGSSGDVTIAPNFTTHVHGGADPQTTADYVLKGNLGMWQDVFRDAGTTVR